VANKRGRGGYTNQFRQMAVKRLKAGANLDDLAKELKVSRRSLYRWRDQLGPAACREEGPWIEADVQKQVLRLTQLLAEKTLEADFFRGALQKVEARRQQRENSGGKASTTRSGK
jgi:transposase-like protein